MKKKQEINNNAIDFVVVFALVALIGSIFGFVDKSSLLFKDNNTNYTIAVIGIMSVTFLWSVFIWLSISKNVFKDSLVEQISKVKMAYYGFLVATLVILFLQVLQITMINAEWQWMDFVYPLSLFICHIVCKNWLSEVGKNV